MSEEKREYIKGRESETRGVRLPKIIWLRLDELSQHNKLSVNAMIAHRMAEALEMLHLLYENGKENQ